MKKKVSLKDIAKEVGVSIATVSYVLSKGKDSKVSVAMSEKIKKVAKKLNYQPNQIAKSLKSGKTFTIGLIVADISNPFFSQIARIIEDAAAHLQYTVLFGSSDEKAKKSWQLIQFLSNRQVDGFIIAPTENSEEQIEYLKEQKIPFVLLDRYFPEINTNYVIMDNFKAGHQAVGELIEQGKAEIGFLAYNTNLEHMQERIRGYREALKEHRIAEKENWLGKVDYNNLKEGVKTAIDKMVVGENPVKALVFATNTLAVEGIRYIDSLKLRVPDDLAIVSFDEGEAFDFYYCPLSFVKQPLEEFGKQAVRILIDSIENPERRLEEKCLEAELVVRASSKGTA